MMLKCKDKAITFLLIIAFGQCNCDNFNKTELIEEILLKAGMNDVQKIKALLQDGKQLDFLSIPCKCKLGICRCCTGLISQFFNRKVCLNVRYIREDFTFNVKVTLNNDTLYQGLLAGRNPKPLCIAPKNVLEGLNVCAKFHDVYFVGQNMNLCFEITGEYEKKELFHGNFNCMRFGSDGFKVTRPENQLPLAPSSPISGSPIGVDAIVDAGPDYIETYDEVLLKSTDQE